jgi:hypothetical protein
MTMAEKNGGQESLGRLFVRELVKATSWGAVFLLAVIILLVGAKQNIKEATDFSFKRAAWGAYYIINDPNVKQDIKEAIDFMSEQSTRQVRRLLAGPPLKQDIKEAIDLWYAYKHNMIKPTGKLGSTQ